jgi:hypothetical protein
MLENMHEEKKFVGLKRNAPAPRIPSPPTKTNSDPKT